MTCEDEFRRRMERFHPSLPVEGEGIPISIKIRPSGGCFHREHSPIAYQIIDEYLRLHPSSDFDFEEHESGPELLVYLAFATNVMSLTANIINLVTAIIKARTTVFSAAINGTHLLNLLSEVSTKMGNYGKRGRS